MIGLALLTIVGTTSAICSPEYQQVQSYRPYRGPYNYGYCYYRPYGNIPMDAASLEKAVDEVLKAASTMCIKEKETTSDESKKYSELYSDFLQNVGNAVQNVKSMSEERERACQAKEQQLNDMEHLVAECARARVNLHEELVACRSSSGPVFTPGLEQGETKKVQRSAADNDEEEEEDDDHHESENTHGKKQNKVKEEKENPQEGKPEEKNSVFIEAIQRTLKTD